MSAFPEDRLDSWKEIAAYLKRGVRTVRRWEREEGLPVHRHVHRVLGSVYAYKSEIESWRQTGPRRPAPPPSAAGGSDSAAGRMKSIAVLPFTNLSADPENAYFAEGLTDEVRADLSKIGALRVISRTSATRFKRTARDVGTLAHQLGVRYILEGSVRRAGDRLRITAQLIDAATDDHLWADKYDGSVEDIFAIQERLIQLLHNGLAVVGDNARLCAALGHAYLQYREAGIDIGDGPLDHAEVCARKVFALDPASASGLQLRGWIHYGRGRIQDAVQDLKAALEIEPNNADTLLLLINCYLISGKVSAARPFIARALAVDPLTPITCCMPAFADSMEGNFATIVEPYRQMCDMDPGNPMARLFYVWALALNRRTDAVGAVLEGFPPELHDTVPARLAFFLAHALTGNAAAAHAAVTGKIEAAAAAADVFARILAQGYALTGMSDRALHWLAMAVDRGFINYPFLARHDPFFRRLRSEPRFQTLMETVRHRWESFES